MDHTGSGLCLSGLDWASLALVLIGALNWGLIGIGMFVTGVGAIERWNLVDLLLGWSPLLEALVYLLVGLAGLYMLYFTYELGATDTQETTTRAD